MTVYEVSYLRGEVARIIAPTMEIRRGSLAETDVPTLEALDAPPNEDDVDEFLLQCPLENEELAQMLSDSDERTSLELSDDELSQFLEDVESWSQNNAWLGGDDWLLVNV